MIRIIRKLLGLCDHKYTLIQEREQKHFSHGESSEKGNIPFSSDLHYISTCDYCGKIKHKKIKL